jgi:hypothetical protein
VRKLDDQFIREHRDQILRCVSCIREMCEAPL